MSNILRFPRPANADIPPEQVLLDSISRNLTDCIVIGRTKEGDLFFAGSMADGGDALWLMELAKKDLLG